MPWELRRSSQAGEAVALELQQVDLAPTFVVARVLVFVGLADRRLPVLLAVDLAEDLGRQAIGRAVVDHLAEAYPKYALIEHLRQHDVVDIDDGRKVPFFAEFGDQPHDLARGLGIERGGRLVHQQQLRALRQSAADADTLPLAAGKLVGPLVHHVVEADAAEQAESLIDVRLRELAEPAPPDADVARTRTRLNSSH